MPFRAGLQLKSFRFYKWNATHKSHKENCLLIFFSSDDPKYGHLEPYANEQKLGGSGRSGRIWRPTFLDSTGQI